MFRTELATRIGWSFCDEKFNYYTFHHKSSNRFILNFNMTYTFYTFHLSKQINRITIYLSLTSETCTRFMETIFLVPLFPSPSTCIIVYDPYLAI